MKRVLFELSNEIVSDNIRETAISLWLNDEYEGDCESEDCVVEEAFDIDDGSTYQILLESEIDYFEEFFNKKNRTDYWKMKSDSIGWAKQAGYRYFVAETAEEFIEEVRPKFEHSIKITNYRNGFEVLVSSHDSPFGDSFFLLPIERSTYEK
jgi:hypothetical protein